MSVGAGKREYFFVLQPVFAEAYCSPVWGNSSVLLLDSINLFCCYKSPAFMKKILLSTYTNKSTNKPHTDKSCQ